MLVGGWNQLGFGPDSLGLQGFLFLFKFLLLFLVVVLIFLSLLAAFLFFF
jgi:hypothetical protein